MPFFGSYFGPDTAVDFLEDWFDPDAGATTPPSTPPGEVPQHTAGGRVRMLSTLAPRPQVPPWRHIEGPAGTMLTEVRRYLNELSERSNTFGNHVEVTFTGAGQSVRVDTGLGGPAKGYHVVRSSADIRVFDGAPPSGSDPTPQRGVIWLQASGAGTVTLYVY